MKAIAILLIAIGNTSFSQETIDAYNVLHKVRIAQASLKAAKYSIERRDTLVTGDIRMMTGNVMVSVNKNDTVLGFHFWAKKDNENGEKIYNGQGCYETDMQSKTYIVSNNSSSFAHMLYSGGGHLVMPDLIKVDTSKAMNISVADNQNQYHIIIHYPDLIQYDVINRKKMITIDKATMLPIAVRQHQETYGKVQDLYFRITHLDINPTLAYNFSALPFIKEYTLLSNGPVPVKPQLSQGIKAPSFKLKTFKNDIISSDSFKGKVVLLDFWEVWCGPCIESFPKVIALYNKYRYKGLEVYGITNDLAQLSAARAFINKKNISFPVLIGNEQLKKDYFLNSVPLYVLINKEGTMQLVSTGYPAELEEIIVKSLE